MAKRKSVTLPVKGSAPKAKFDDDFVMTISDSDDDVPILDEEESEVESEDEAPTATSPEPEVRGKKRKLAEKPSKPAKPANDGGMDSDFEFQTGDNGDGVGEYDGWGFEGAHAAMKDQKKGVDIDDLIRRRKEKQAAEGKTEDDDDEEEADDESDEADAEEEEEDEDEEEKEEAEADNSEEEEGDVTFAGFEDDDEDIAADGFGAGAESEEEEAAKDSADEDDDEDDEEAEEDEDDDNESVASEVPHPDDLANSDAESDEDNAEEKAKKAAFFAPEDELVFNPDPSASFQNMNLSRPIMRGIANVGFSTPTLIQQKAIPVALLGKDVVGGAQTGSGKTAAFVIPILERLLYRPKKVASTRVLILCPTRELAIQAHSVAVKLAAYTDIKFGLAVGGLSVNVQAAELKKRPDIIIGTPGRFIDHMRNSQGFGVDTIEIVVLDEADRMLEDGFADELNEIINTIPKSRQTMLFSATMTDSVDKLIRLSLQRPVRLMVDTKKTTVKTLVQEFVRIRPQREKHKLAMLIHICKELVSSRCIVFFRSKVFAHRVRVVFSLLGLKATELHGSLTQEQRVKAVEAFRDGSVDFLLATDLASRGLDIKNVDVVINFELPQSYDIYQHRIGRTARAGRSGRSITLATEAERKIVKTAVRNAQAQGAKVVSRVLDNDKVDTLHVKLEKLETEVDEVLEEEKNERHIQTLEMQVRRSENLMKHEDEIRARPKRTWFESQREKAEAKKVSKAELNGLELPEKRTPMSGKKRKREELKEEKSYKKTKADRVVKAQRGGVKAQAKKDAKKIVRKMEAKDGMKKGRSAPKKGGFKGKPKGRK
ncbi:P-loop containing nucleoside triphosphate hydrolase protein [Pyronema domesticum]|uniref:RNA helicase n=1 Tax=Pyronema omphalodes (strain CBS 100304) TaxID=1076935 RepID=U4LNT9_PYROM|nr:P-loop containing nucleoside triphosphate hydrolase protein [Pyronema domesticum]CCX33618.1 Similar to ATP-dependent RNA helicase DRS1; acc. no. Q4I830 [Pyronema omphalodes CBS 100304]